jgi:hypothetical protein
MSDEKKTTGGKGYSTLQGQAADAPMDAAQSGRRRETKNVDTQQKPRHQHVLPDILGKQLRAAYGELLSTPVPDAINDLIKQLEAKEAAISKSKAAKPQDEENGE